MGQQWSIGVADSIFKRSTPKSLCAGSDCRGCQVSMESITGDMFLSNDKLRIIYVQSCKINKAGHFINFGSAIYTNCSIWLGT